MVNVLYTLWGKEYDDGRKTFLYTATRGGTGIPRESETIEELVDYHIANHGSVAPHLDDWRFPDNHDSLTTIKAIKRKFHSDFTEFPLDDDYLKQFEKLFEQRKAKLTPAPGSA